MNIPTQMLDLAPRRGTLSLLMLTTLTASLSAQAAFDSGSTGSDGALSPTVNTAIPLPESGVLNYTSINIPSGVTVTFIRNIANTPVYLLAKNDVTIAGAIDIRGGDAKPSGTSGDGALADDGLPGLGGPGGYDGGRGGTEDVQQRASIIRGGAGLGPGGGEGGIEGSDGCVTGRYMKYVGVGGGYATGAYSYYVVNGCGSGSAYYVPLGKSYGSTLLQPLLGGSGGGGGRGGTVYPGTGGGGGGGALLLATSGILTINGSIDATGGDGGGNAGTGAGGQGAGGSGGAIRLMASSIKGNNARRQYCGSAGNYYEYGGAPGRIRLEANNITYTGSTSPTYVKDLPGPVFIANSPTLRIASVAGSAVPANPTGNADIVLPATTTGPVDVVFETINVPTGNTILLRIVPATGTAIEILSPAITGTAASGTASVKATLPSGPSTLQATTTYTVVLAGSLDLSRFAHNEAVEKVEVTVPLTGEPRARLLTASGKAYEVSYAALRAAGFRG
ncbi:MAG: hypothetical protein ACOYMG_16335 [Candidatus Methylumidiphilus sp.]